MKRINTDEIQVFETEHAAQLRRLAPECMVLLRSSGNFPLEKPGKVALYGSGARKTIKGGTGSGDVNVRAFTNIEDGLENAGFTVTTKAWLDSYDGIIVKAYEQFKADLKAEAKKRGVPVLMMAMGMAMPEPNYSLPLEGEGDTCLYILARNSGEGNDRKPVAGDIDLTETEIRDIRKLESKYENFLLVLNVGGVVDISTVPEIGNVLLMSQLGTASGDVLADVILGKSYPSGKLTTTWAPIREYPSTEGFADPNDTRYREGIYVGYRYFDTIGKAPYFPFGYGLGYTIFDVADGRVSVSGSLVTVEATVKNRGDRKGKEIVQVYYSAPEGRLDKPFQELAAYGKTAELAGGESETLSLSFEIADMASYDRDSSSYVIEKGIYYIRVGNCSRSTHICGALSFSEDIRTSQLKNVGGQPDFDDLKIDASPFGYSGEDEEKASVNPIPIDLSAVESVVVDYSEAPAEIKGDGASFEDVSRGEAVLDDFIAGLTDRELAYLCIGDFNDDGGLSFIGNAASTVAGAAGESTNRLSDRGVPSLVMADGPAGLRLSTIYSLIGGKAKPEISALPESMFELLDEDSMKMFGIDPEKQSPKGEGKPGERYYQYCSSIPIGTALAQSWNDRLCRECGDIIGREMEMFGIHLWLAPAHNIHRSPLCGRNFEYMSEDPYLSGCMAAAITNGVQEHEGCGTTVKHFFCNNQETNRTFSNSILSERALREIYLKSFEVCIRKSGPHALMTSYNLVNGEHACNRRDVITHVLRDEWDFKGIVMTDWLVTGGMGSKGERHPCASAAGNVWAGNDITMPGMVSDLEDMLAALDGESHNYPISRGDLQACAKRVLGMILRLV